MSIRKELLQSHFKELKGRWEQLSQKLRVISKQRDLETRADEKMRMDAVIFETETERKQVEAELEKRQLELEALTTPTDPAASSTPRAQNVTKPSGPIEIFYSYSHKDEALRDKLETHLKILERQGIISGWYDRGIGAGTEWKNQINQHLEAAHIILLLISADFIASDYCWGKELERAMERHENGEARVIPIILREVDWSGAPFSKLQALPKDGKPVTGWPNQDEAFAHIVRGIRAVSRELAAN